MGDDMPNLTNSELKAAVKTVVATTGGVTFSKRVWSDMDGLKAELDVQLVNSLVQGQSVAVIAKNLLPFVSEKFQNKRYAAERIARTESARVDTDATLASLKKYGYKYCQWHDETKACDTCMAIARSNPTGYGQGVYEVDDVPYLPAHPNCRCSISAYWVDDEKLTTAEEGAIIRYKGPDSYVLNDALRNEIPLNSQQQQMVTQLDNAIKKLPKYRDDKPLYRSYNKGVFDVRSYAAKIVKEGYAQEENYFSTSKEVYDPNDDFRIIILQSKSGADLNKYDNGEKEVLFKRNTKFNVKRYYLDERGKPIIEVVEDET